MTIGGLSLSIFLLSVGLTCSALAHTAPVPFVGCRSDGQIEPEPAPKTSKNPLLPVVVALRLAWYASRYLGVLTPRGWKCLGLHGSNGSILLVVPDHARRAVPDTDSPIKGKGIQC